MPSVACLNVVNDTERCSSLGVSCSSVVDSFIAGHFVGCSLVVNSVRHHAETSCLDLRLSHESVFRICNAVADKNCPPYITRVFQVVIHIAVNLANLLLLLSYLYRILSSFFYFVGFYSKR